MGMQLRRIGLLEQEISLDRDVAVTRVLTPTATGLFDITIAGLDFTPIAARFIIAHTGTDGVAVTHTSLGYGATDGINQWSVSYQSTSGVVNTINSNYGSDLHCVTLQNGGSSSIRVQASVDSFIADGVRLNFNIADATQYFLTVILYGGSTFTNAQAGVITASSTGTAITESVGFPPNVVYAGMRTSTQFDETVYDFDISRGFAAWDGTTVTQAGTRHLEADGDTTPSPQIRVESGAVGQVWTLSDFTATSFDATATAGGTPADMGYLALEVPSENVKVEIVDSPITTGVQPLGSTTFTPKYCALLLTAAQSTGVDITNNANAGPFGMAEITAAQSYCNATANETASTTNTQTLSDNQAINFPYDDGTVFYEGPLDGFTMTGVNVNLTSAGDGTVRKWPALFIG